MSFTTAAYHCPTELEFVNADDPGDVREVNLLIRVSPAERDRIHRDAASRGETASDYVRQRLGLRTRAERRMTTQED